MILGQHKAAQFRPEVAIHPARQRRYDQLPVRRQPALPAIADAAGPQDQVLNDEICVALKPRAGWHRGLDDLVFDGHARRHRTAAALAKVRRLRLAGLLHSARFERWPALEPFQPCDLRTLGRYRLLQGRHLAQQPDDKRLQFSRGECVEVTGWSHPSRESEASVSGKRKPRCRTHFAAVTKAVAKPKQTNKLEPWLRDVLAQEHWFGHDGVSWTIAETSEVAEKERRRRVRLLNKGQS